MVNYSNGKIYKIEPMIEHDEGDIYIGSTTKKYLSQRMDYHRYDYKRWKQGKGRCTSFDLFDKYGVENCHMVLIEKVKAETKDELLSREKYYIQKFKCVNKHIPIRTKEEIADYKAEWYQGNKQDCDARNKLYYEKHKPEVQVYKQKHYNENKEHYLNYKKEWYQKNKERISEKQKKLYNEKKLEKDDHSK